MIKILLLFLRSSESGEETKPRCTAECDFDRRKLGEVHLVMRAGESDSELNVMGIKG